MPPASRVESDSKTTPPRWKKEKDDYKADLSKYPEEIKDLCPIVITSIDCRPTRFKDADGKELKVTSHSKNGLVHTVKLISRREVKDGVLTEVLDGPERSGSPSTSSTCAGTRATWPCSFGGPLTGVGPRSGRTASSLRTST